MWMRAKTALFGLLLKIRRRPLLSFTCFAVPTALYLALIYYLYESEATEPSCRSYIEALKDIGIYFLSGFDTDQKPHTQQGWSCAWSLLLLGVCYVGMFTASVADLLIHNRARRGICTTQVTFKNHILLCGWTGRARQILEELFSPDLGHPPSVVIIDPKVEEAPMDHPLLRVIRGDPTKREVLRQANAYHAAKAIILADPEEVDVDDADARSLLIALAIEKFRGEIYSCVEVLNPDNVKLFDWVEVDEVVSVTEIANHLCVHAAMDRGLSSVITSMVTFDEGDELYRRAVPPRYVGRTFAEVAVDLLQEGIVLVGSATQVPRRAVDGAADEAEPARPAEPVSTAADGPVEWRGHTVFCGWNERGHRILDQFFAPDAVGEPVVVIDPTISARDSEAVSHNGRPVRVVRADPTTRRALIEANAKEAKQAIVLAHRDRTRPDTADARNLHVALAIETYRPEIYSCVEVLNPENVGHFRRIRVDEVISVMGISNQLCVHAALNPGVSRLITDMVTFGEGEELHSTPVPPAYVEHTFGELAADLIQWRQQVLVAVRSPAELAPQAEDEQELTWELRVRRGLARMGQWLRRDDEPPTTARVLQAGDRVYVLCDDAEAAAALSDLRPGGNAEPEGEPAEAGTTVITDRDGRAAPAAEPAEDAAVTAPDGGVEVAGTDLAIVAANRLAHRFAEGDFAYLLARDARSANAALGRK